MPRWVRLPADWSHAHTRDVWVNMDRVDYVEFWVADGEEHVGLNGIGVAAGRSSDRAFVGEVRACLEGRGDG